MFTGGRKFVLIALFTAFLIALVNLVWWLSYRRTETMLDGQLGRRLAAVAQTASVSFTPDLVDSLAAGGLDAYLETISILQQTRRADSLSEVFILDEDFHYLASTLLEPDSVYFLAGVNGATVDSVLYGLVAGGLATQTYTSGPFYLKSAFAPLVDGEGSVRAVLGVEANVDYFDSLAELKRNLYFATGLSLVGGIVLGLLFLMFQRRIARAEERLFLNETHAHLGRMVAVVAHELRNPLMIIRGSAERLAKQTEMDEAGYVVEEVDRLNEIVTGYLDFAKAGGSLLASDTPQPVNCTELVTGIREHLFERHVSQEVTWIGEAPSPDLTVRTYARSLRQVLLNLLFNGVESCLHAKKPVEVGLTVSAGGGAVEFRVVDHGAGLSRSDQKKVFTPFYTTKRSGSGLGLYLSRMIVQQMGGRIELESRPGEKTEVIIRLPKEPKS
jgi:signal transduction histidine kinase